MWLATGESSHIRGVATTAVSGQCCHGPVEAPLAGKFQCLAAHGSQVKGAQLKFGHKLCLGCNFQKNV